VNAPKHLRARSVPRPSDALASGIKALDWPRIGDELSARGCATTGALLSPQQCAALVETYAQDAPFRSRVIMARYGFGRGEYKYFAYPLPELVATLRTVLYPPLAAIANAWNDVIPRRTRLTSRVATLLANPSRRRCCCDMAPTTLIACTRTSTASRSSRCKRPSCFPSPAAISAAVSSC
jgi:uncharacterized protein